MKRIVFPVLAVIVIAVAAIGTSKSTSFADKTPHLETAPTLLSTINGATHPEKIPDHLAFSLLFQLIAGRETEAEKGRIKSYIRQMGLGDADSDILVAASEEYRIRVANLSERASQVLLRYHPTHPPLTVQDKNQLQELGRQRESATNDIVASLRHRLSKDGLAALRRHINDRVKRKTTITPDEEP